jgi:hypothetical protein
MLRSTYLVEVVSLHSSLNVFSRPNLRRACLFYRAQIEGRGMLPLNSHHSSGKPLVFACSVACRNGADQIVNVSGEAALIIVTRQGEDQQVWVAK